MQQRLRPESGARQCHACCHNRRSGLVLLRQLFHVRATSLIEPLEEGPWAVHAQSQWVEMVDYSKLSRDDLIRLFHERDGADAGGIRLTYPGQTPPWQIVRQLKPRSQRIERKLSVGGEDSQSENALIEGENLQALVSLYKYRAQVDLVLTDPPYNTGLDFRYNDRWDEDPNDPNLGTLVPADDGSRHSKWLRFMTPRMWMMKEMLKPGGILAICIDHRELFRLGMMLDEMFGENNRIGIINWQKSYAPRNDQRHISTAQNMFLFMQRTPSVRKQACSPAPSRWMLDTCRGIMTPILGSQVT